MAVALCGWLAASMEKSRCNSRKVMMEDTPYAC